MRTKTPKQIHEQWNRLAAVYIERKSDTNIDRLKRASDICKCYWDNIYMAYGIANRQCADTAIANHIWEYGAQPVSVYAKQTEVKPINKANMTIVYKGVNFGDHVKCNNCEKTMLLPCGADRCPECGVYGCLAWVDEDNPERDITEIGQTEFAPKVINPCDLYPETEV